MGVRVFVEILGVVDLLGVRLVLRFLLDIFFIRVLGWSRERGRCLLILF